MSKQLPTVNELTAKQIDRAFNALGGHSTASCRRQLMELVNAYNDLRRSGKLSAREQQCAYVGLQQSVAKVKRGYARGLSRVSQASGDAAALYRLMQDVGSRMAPGVDVQENQLTLWRTA